MNTSPDLQALMALDALGEATSEQHAELQIQLGENPALAHQSAAMCDLAGLMEDIAGPVPLPVPVPASAMARMEAARAGALAKATAAQAHAAGINNVVALTGALPSSNGGKVAATAQDRRPWTVMPLLAWAAVITLLAAPIGWWLSHQDSATVATASPALAPRGETGMTQPTLVWENAPQQDYDVWILPDGAYQKTAPALFVANKVRSPLSFASLKPGPANVPDARELQPGSRYLALVCLAGHGRLAGVTVAFQTAPAALGAPPTPSDPATALALMQQLEAAGRYSDALMVLVALPPPVANHPEIVVTGTRLRARLKQERPQ